nr:MAG TPA: hypothetical protein [Caudoviricetes sp.]
METVETQVVETPITEKTVETKVETPSTETKVENGNGAETKTTEPYKTFISKEDFDKHSAGILNSAKNKAEKELLAMLGLKPDEKDKLAKFKEAYDATLSESEKQAKNLENLTSEVNSLKSQIAEKDAIIATLGKLTGKTSADVSKYVKMAKGLVDENTTIDQALEQVLSFMKIEEPKTNPVPAGKPLSNPAPVVTDENPFKTGNMTKQGELIRTDREKARALYMAVHGVGPAW